jgi:hypothetical protein
MIRFGKALDMGGLLSDSLNRADFLKHTINDVRRQIRLATVDGVSLPAGESARKSNWVVSMPAGGRLFVKNLKVSILLSKLSV